MDNGTGDLGYTRTSGDYLNDSIIKIGQNTEKSPEDLRRLAVTQIPVKDHQANTDVKNSQGVSITIIKKTCRIVDFAIPADPRIKLKESEKKDTYLDLVKELKKLLNMKVR